MDTIAKNVKKNLCLSALYPSGSYETIIQRIERLKKDNESGNSKAAR